MTSPDNLSKEDVLKNNLDEKRLKKLLKLWAKRHGVPDTWEPKPLLVKWLMSWKKEGKIP